MAIPPTTLIPLAGSGPFEVPTMHDVAALNQVSPGRYMLSLVSENDQVLRIPLSETGIRALVQAAKALHPAYS